MAGNGSSAPPRCAPSASPGKGETGGEAGEGTFLGMGYDKGRRRGKDKRDGFGEDSFDPFGGGGGDFGGGDRGGFGGGDC